MFGLRAGRSRSTALLARNYGARRPRRAVRTFVEVPSPCRRTLLPARARPRLAFSTSLQPHEKAPHPG
jgi:hypothetical protein